MVTRVPADKVVPLVNAAATKWPQAATGHSLAGREELGHQRGDDSGRGWVSGMVSRMTESIGLNLLDTPTC